MLDVPTFRTTKNVYIFDFRIDYSIVRKKDFLNVLLRMKFDNGLYFEGYTFQSEKQSFRINMI